MIGATARDIARCYSKGVQENDGSHRLDADDFLQRMANLGGAIGRDIRDYDALRSTDAENH